SSLAPAACPGSGRRRTAAASVGPPLRRRSPRPAQRPSRSLTSVSSTHFTTSGRNLFCLCLQDQARVQRLWAGIQHLDRRSHDVVVLDLRTGKLVQIRVPPRPQPKPAPKGTKV